MHHGLFVIHWWTILIIIVVNVSTNHRTTSPSLVLLEAALNSALRVRSPIWRLYLTNGVFVFSSGSGSSLKVTLMEESGGFLSHVFVIVFVYDSSGLLLMVTLVEERRRRRSDCISVRKTATWSSVSVLPINFNIKGSECTWLWQYHQ